MRKNIICIGLLLSIFNAYSQTNSLDIRSSLQSSTDPTSVFNAWQIIEISPAMQTAPCYQNTTFAQGPGFGLTPVPPVDLTNGPQDAYVVFGGALSCFPYNTIYTPFVSATNVTDYATTFRRRFFVCGDVDAAVTFNFDIQCDDYIQTISLDGNVTWDINRYSINPHVFFNQTVSLSPGLHTIDIRASDWQNPGGSYFTVQGNPMQWNPFAFSISGTIETPSSVLFNYNSGTSCVVPVKLAHFTASQQGDRINLNWKTASEENVAEYEIEKSIDGDHFYAIGAVTATGNAATGKTYGFSDTKIEKVNSIYYRLKIVDRDGTKSFSPVAVVKPKFSGISASVKCNPVSNLLQVEINCAENNRGEILITGASGTTVKRLPVNFQKGQNKKEIDMSAFSNGVYFVKIKTDREQVVLKFLKTN